MKLWLDAQLPPQLTKWLTQEFAVEATAVRDLGLRDSSDAAIFQAARLADADSVPSPHHPVLTPPLVPHTSPTATII